MRIFDIQSLELEYCFSQGETDTQSQETKFSQCD